MSNEADSPGRAAQSTRPALKVGDCVAFAGDVLRVIAGTEPSLLIMIAGSGAKVTIEARRLDQGDKLRGGDPARLAATVTRVPDGPYSDFTPISLAVDGYAVSRVTLAAKWLTRVG